MAAAGSPFPRATRRRAGSGQYSLSLLPAAPAPAQRSTRLWLCIYCSQLAVDAALNDVSLPAVVTEAVAGRILVYAANPVASACGIRAGMSLSSALALCGELQSLPRNSEKEQQLRQGIAAFAYQTLSNIVSLDYPQCIVVEIGASRRLWPTLKQLRDVVSSWLQHHGLSAGLAWAPTARAAYWLACAKQQRPVLESESLAARLHGVSLHHAIDDERLLQRFANSGLTTLGDAMRMPRDAFARRGALELLQHLDEALGKRAQVLPLWRPLPWFSETVELPLATGNVSLLRPVVVRLLRSFCAFLKTHQAATRRLHIRLMHLHEPVTTMTLGFSRYLNVVDDMLLVFDAQISRCKPSAEVVAIALRCRHIVHLSEQHNDLLDKYPGCSESWMQLQDLMVARLGSSPLHKLAVSEDHRPEYAARANVAAVWQKGPDNRPLWLLQSPQRLLQEAGAPCWRGRLQLCSAAERIEQGWWQGDDVRRDYYMAKTPQGSLVWIYQELRQRQWFLHGIFG